ncbi:MAG: 3-isopropylmalate dehydratase [Desulfobacula sp.]|jgi:3-isopropylmalate/(R)-2-methylmalate dehydratase small subunit|nr:3-isopropylmalate dehydratase [Desulfobacula sp.]
MNRSFSGRAFVFGKNIDTDQIYPGRFVELIREKDIACHAMAGVDPGFVKIFKRGDIIVAGTNFGCGSSREHAAITLKAIGTACVIAESFGRIFYRNAINIGLPVIVCPGVSQEVRQEDVLSVNIETGQILNLTNDTELKAQPLTGYPLEILSHGGIKSLIKNRTKDKSL